MVSPGQSPEPWGLYELVRRRCHRILIRDGEEHGNYVFEGLGMAIRRCRRTGTSSRRAARSAPCGTFSSSTMMVMMMAITPSLNASGRPFPCRSP
jgi:hypothetical protein